MKQGFSLVELSIVLVILGLLTGGILAGQSLIRAAELRAVGTEYQRWLTATHSFRDKYMAIPGDFRDATQFWGRQQSSDCVSNAGIVATTTTGVCDGDGNNQVYAAGTGETPQEVHQFWRHLASAGLIEGTYTGIAGPNNIFQSVIGTNAPASKLNRGGWGTQWAGHLSTSNIYYFAGFYGNIFSFGSAHSTSLPVNPLLIAEEAWNIDTKIDDGSPAKGKMTVRIGNSRVCAVKAGVAAIATDFDATYNLSDTTEQCGFYFGNAY